MSDNDKGMRGDANEIIQWFLTDEEIKSQPTLSEIVLMKKICMLGDPGVGKTSLIARFVYSTFDDKYIRTIGAKVTKKVMALEHLSSGKKFRLKMLIWDIAGHDTLNFIKPTYYKDAEGAILVADITRKETILNIPNWQKSFYEVTGRVPVILFINKNDLRDDADYTEEDVEDISQKISASYFYTSAKTGESVEMGFSALGRAIISQHIEHSR